MLSVGAAIRWFPSPAVCATDGSAGRARSSPCRPPSTATPSTAMATSRRGPQVGPDSLALDLPSPWPFGGRATQRFALSSDRLELELGGRGGYGADASDDRVAPLVPPPAGAGRRRGAQLRRPVPLRPRRPPHPHRATGRDGRGPWDDCFTELGPFPRLTWPGALTLTLEHDCSHLVVYTEPERRHLRRTPDRPARRLQHERRGLRGRTGPTSGRSYDLSLVHTRPPELRQPRRLLASSPERLPAVLSKSAETELPAGDREPYVGRLRLGRGQSLFCSTGGGLNDVAAAASSTDPLITWDASRNLCVAA